MEIVKYILKIEKDFFAIIWELNIQLLKKLKI